MTHLLLADTADVVGNLLERFGLPTVLLFGLLYVLWRVGKFAATKIIAKLVNDEGTGLFQRWVNAHLQFVERVEMSVAKLEASVIEVKDGLREQKELWERTVARLDDVSHTLDGVSRSLDDLRDPAARPPRP